MTELISKKPKVSVIMPAYNAEGFIGEAINSILNQTFRDLELIIIDDKSVDGTVSVIESFVTKDSRIRFFRHKKNQGIGATRNEGIKLALGEYLVWQDADDISMPTRIQKQVTLLESNNSLGAVGCALKIFDEDGERGVRKYPTEDRLLRKMIFKCNPIAQPAAVFRREVFKELGGYDESYKVASEDLEMFFRVGTKYHFGNIDEALVRYRLNKNSLTYKNLKEMELTTIRLRLKYSLCEAYSPSFLDYIYNFFQYISAFIVPANIKIWLFNAIRNSK